MQRACHGFTLLEVLASLVLLALLMVGVYSGIRTASVSARAGSAMIERSDQIRAAQQFVRRELAQAMAQPLARNRQGEPLVFFGSAREMRYIAPLPGYLGRLGPQLQRLQLVDDGAGGLRLELSLALLPPDGGAPQALGETQILLDHIRAGGFTYTGFDDRGAPVAYTETIAATPTAPPSCWVVCSRPDAEPACSGSTPPSTVAVTGMKMRPVDRPAISTGPKTESQ